MRVRVLYFAILKERRGRAQEDVDLPEGATASSAFDHLFPGIGLPVAFAVNEAMVPGVAPLHDGDELAFLPPLGGG